MKMRFERVPYSVSYMRVKMARCVDSIFHCAVVCIFVICKTLVCSTHSLRGVERVEKNLFVFYFISFFDSKIYDQLVRWLSFWPPYLCGRAAEPKKGNESEKYDIIIISSFTLLAFARACLAFYVLLNK